MPRYFTNSVAKLPLDPKSGSALGFTPLFADRRCAYCVLLSAKVTQCFARAGVWNANAEARLGHVCDDPPHQDSCITLL